MNLNEYMLKYGTYAKEKGFWDIIDSENVDNLPIRLCLIHSEISETLEAYRHNDNELLREEIADIFIRLFDFCYRYKIDIEKEIEKKMKKNSSRPFRHGNKRW